MFTLIFQKVKGLEKQESQYMRTLLELAAIEDQDIKEFLKKEFGQKLASLLLLGNLTNKHEVSKTFE